LKTLATVAAAAALVVAPLVSTGAMAADEPSVGKTGQLVEWVPKSNDVGYWEKQYAAHDAVCYKVDGANSSGHGTVSADGKTVTLKPFDQSWPGDHWELLVIKAGNLWNNVIVHPEAGVAYASPENNGGQQAVISHWIVCKGETPEGQPQSVTPTLSWTLPTCDEAGTLTQGNGVTWTSAPGEEGHTIWTATPAPGNVFTKDAKTVWDVPSLAQLVEECTQPPAKVEPKDKTVLDCTSQTATVTTTTTTTPYVWDDETEEWVLDTANSTSVDSVVTRDLTDAEKATCPPGTKVEYGEWQDGVWACGDTTVTQTREVTTTTYTRNGEDVVVPTTTKNSETQTRPLTPAEIGANCDLVPGEIDSVCVGDVPYLGYEVSLPEGFETDDENPVTITFVNPDGDDYVVGDQPLSGVLLWPGASAGNPKMWPGWELVNGEYAQTDGNYAWTRSGVTVRFEVNPSYSTEIFYPEASAECANPPVGGGDDPTGTPTSTDSEALAATGGGISPMFAVAGGAALFAGISAVVIAAYRRRQAGMR
jgi:hypothetical protein